MGSSDPRGAVERWIAAINARDLEAIVSCFHPEYEDVAPARRGEIVRGRDGVRSSFGRLLDGIPDIRAEVDGTVVDGETVWMEWRMQGTRSDGSAFEFAGVNIFGVADGLLRWGRIYTELVRDVGGLEGQVGRMAAGS